MFGIGTITGKITPCSKGLFYSAIDAEKTKEICDLIATLQKQINTTSDSNKKKWAQDRISGVKRLLPVITPMAHFKNEQRKVANAIPSGLNMLDIDHIDNPRELWESVKDKMPYKTFIVHVTPSGYGLRIIFKQPSNLSIADAQLKVAKALKVNYDSVTKDLARCSFLVCRQYFIMIDDSIFEDVEQAPDVEEEKKVPEETQTAVTDFPKDFKGISYSSIIDALLLQAGYDSTPTTGERNNALYMLVRNLRYVCDFNAEFIASVLPNWDLPEHEVQNTIDSALKSVRMASMPSNVKKIIDGLGKEQGAPVSLYDDKIEISPDGLIAEFVNLQPHNMRTAAYLVAMTCFGTLLTSLRGRGCDGSVLAPNFMLTVSAPQATGKSFMKRIFEMICAPIKAEDEKQRELLRKIDKENKRNKDKEDYEEQEFNGAIRLLPSNTSNRILLERLDLAKKKHCMIVAEEIDSITKAEKSGKWSEKSDIYRLAYDNSEWGQDYASENSYKAVVQVYLNLLFSGTPAAVARFFNDIENGLVTRFLFVDLPDTYGQKRPMRQFMSEEKEVEISEKLKKLYEKMQSTGTEDGLIWMDTTKMVEDAIAKYDEVQRLAYLTNQEEVCRDLARRRYADYVVKMMMIETYLNDGVYTEEIRDRVLSVMEFCTNQLIANYGDEINKSLNESVEKQAQAVARNKKVDMLKALPDEFTISDFVEVMKTHGYKTSSSSASTYCTRLVKAGLVVKLDRGKYKKN